LRDLHLMQVTMSFRFFRLGNAGRPISPRTAAQGDHEERAADQGRPAHEPCVSGLSLGLLPFGLKFALALPLSFRPLGLTRLAALRQEAHGRRESGMVARGPSLVRLVLLAPIERQL
jgi:hypothetical protein